MASVSGGGDSKERREKLRKLHTLTYLSHTVNKITKTVSQGLTIISFSEVRLSIFSSIFLGSNILNLSLCSPSSPSPYKLLLVYTGL